MSEIRYICKFNWPVNGSSLINIITFPSVLPTKQWFVEECQEHKC